MPSDEIFVLEGPVPLTEEQKKMTQAAMEHVSGVISILLRAAQAELSQVFGPDCNVTVITSKGTKVAGLGSTLENDKSPTRGLDEIEQVLKEASLLQARVMAKLSTKQ